MAYPGRPGISPALAALIAQGTVRKEHAILDVGCGKGTDALLLASWGFKRVIGVDADAASVAVARRRATRKRLGRHVRFEPWPAEDLPKHVPLASVDVVLHTLVANNLKQGFRRHFEGIARVLRPGGLLISHVRTDAGSENLPPGRVRPVPGMRRYFDISPGITTQLAEFGEYEPPYARVALWLGRRRV